MNPVIRLDVAKGESQVQAFVEKKKPYKKTLKSHIHWMDYRNYTPLSERWKKYLAQSLLNKKVSQLTL